jgi:predicted methyltransferase
MRRITGTIRRRLPSPLLVFAAALVVAGPVAAQDLRLELPDRVPAQVMSYRGADWLERPERESEELPDEVLEVMALEVGDVVADLGAGSGYYTRRMAPLVGPDGHVYAVDIQPEMLEILERNMGEEGITNVVTVLGEVDDPMLPPGEIDWIFLADVYHEFSDPEPMLEGMREALAPGGRVALLEYRVEDGTGDHILADHRMSVRQVMSEWVPAGFELVALHEFLPGQHLFVFRAQGDGVAPEGPAIRHHDLLEASAAGNVTASVRGAGPGFVTLTVRRSTPDPIVVTFPVGTYFVAADGVSDMVARRDGMVLLTEEERSWTVAVRGVDPELGIPGPEDDLRIESADDHRRARNVMWVFQGLDFPQGIAPVLEQVTLWIATADVGYDMLVAALEGAPIPPANAIALGLAYLETAGMDVMATRLWSERERFVSSLTDPSLAGLFDGWGMP